MRVSSRYCGLQSGSELSVPRVLLVHGYGVGAVSEAVMSDNEDEGYVIFESLSGKINNCVVNVMEIDPFETVESVSYAKAKLILAIH